MAQSSFLRSSRHCGSAIAAGLMLLAPGCSAVVEQRVETGLVEAGLSAAMANCMAPIWANELSVEQIRGISQLAGKLRAERQTLTVARLLEHASNWNDPKALGVMTSSAARCALR